MTSISEIPDPPIADDALSSVSWLGGMVRRTGDVLKQNLVPGLILQAFVVLVIGGDYFVQPVTDFFDKVADFKQSAGLVYSGVSTAIFAGLIPFLIQKSRPKFRDQIPAAHIWFYLVFWFFMGMEFDLMMRLQAWLFGSQGDWVTTLCKTTADMLVYTPLMGLPTICIALLWRQTGFDFGKTLSILRDRLWWSNQYMSILIANWIVWPLALAGVYSLPLALQIPVQNLVMCFWCVLLIFLSDESV